MRPLAVAAVLFAAVLAAVPPASAQDAGPCTETVPTVCLDDQDCQATVTTTGAWLCVVRADGVIDSHGYYFVWCVLEGAVYVCYTDSSETEPCLHVEATDVCPQQTVEDLLRPFARGSAADPLACAQVFVEVCAGDFDCLVEATTSGTSACVGHVEGVFDPTGYYLIVCAVEGAVYVCFTDSSEADKCVHVESESFCLVAFSL